MLASLLVSMAKSTVPDNVGVTTLHDDDAS